MPRETRLFEVEPDQTNYFDANAFFSGKTNKLVGFDASTENRSHSVIGGSENSTQDKNYEVTGTGRQSREPAGSRENRQAVTGTGSHGNRQAVAGTGRQSREPAGSRGNRQSRELLRSSSRYWGTIEAWDARPEVRVMKRRKTKKAERKAVKELSTGYQLSREILEKRRGGGVRGLTNTFTYTPTDSARLGGA